ncbi:MAG: hypothetical protein E7299_07075 [Lachnospiraceae bacterium]|nr:hypothetical protein [Lachnospiraceae bacterium]
MAELFFYDKKIRYLNYYENDIRMQNAGYVKFEVRDYECHMMIFVKGPRLLGNGEARIWFLTKTARDCDKDKRLLGTIAIRLGQGRRMLRLNAEDMGETGLSYRQIAGIRIELQRQQYLESSWEIEEDYKAELESVNDVAKEEEIQEEQNGKWQEWKEVFPIIHPIDDRECLKVSPKELEILPEKEKVLMYNSFLLHGYYNYRHLILWKEDALQGLQVCLGVPGVFHEREKVLAKMFGFDYFCCQNKAPRSGSFGYYYRYVFMEDDNG